MRKKSTPRERKLDSIATRIAMFLVNDTWTDETDIQAHLNDALSSLKAASKKMSERMKGEG